LARGKDIFSHVGATTDSSAERGAACGERKVSSKGSRPRHGVYVALT
jgi:hypothetical protein